VKIKMRQLSCQGRYFRERRQFLLSSHHPWVRP
jgi:hypothetical protein